MSEGFKTIGLGWISSNAHSECDPSHLMCQINQIINGWWPRAKLIKLSTDGGHLDYERVFIIK
jgi:hypothetical protein